MLLLLNRLLDGCKVIEFDIHTKSFNTWIRNEYGEKEIQNLTDIPSTQPDTQCFNKYKRRYNDYKSSSSSLVFWNNSQFTNLYYVVFIVCGTTFGIGIYYLYHYCKEVHAKRQRLVIYRKQSSYISDSV